MKRYDELSADQQERAVEESLRRVLSAVTEGRLRFNDVANGNDLQAKIDATIDELEGSATPYAVFDLVLLRCRPELVTLARLSAKDAVYVEGDTVIAIDDL